MSELTDEQRRRMEENRKQALARRAARAQHKPPSNSASRTASGEFSFQGNGSGVPTTKTSFITPAAGAFASSGKASTSLRNSVNTGPAVACVRPLSNRSEAPLNQTKMQARRAKSFYSSGQSSSNKNQCTVSREKTGGTYGQVKSLEKWNPQHNLGAKNKQCDSSLVNQSWPHREGGKKPESRTKAEFRLISRTHFEVCVAYHGKLIEIFKTMPTRVYNSEARRWSFHLRDYEALMKMMGELNTEVQREPLPKAVLQTFRRSMRNTEGSENTRDPIAPEADLSDVDSDLVDTLMPFQRQGVNFAVRNGGRVLIADDMGLGKTLQALCVAAVYRDEWPLLVVVPSSVRFAWRDQIWRWMKSVDRDRVHVAVTGKDNCRDGLIIITSYDLMMRKAAELEQRDFRVVIFDESHFLKTHTSKRAKASASIIKKARRAILLSGTPALSRPKELFVQVSALDPKLFKGFHEFGVRYCDGKQLPFGWDYSGSSNMTELQLLLKERLMIRRLKHDVITELPEKRRQMVLLDPSSVKINRNMKSTHQLVGNAKGSDRRSMILQYFHDTATAKVPAVKQYMLDQLEAGHKFLLFAHHQEMLNALADALTQGSWGYIRIDGSTSAAARNDLCGRFHADSGVQVALLSITAANAGLNMTAASLVVFGELFWNPGILVQAEDRAHRIGQEDSVNVHYLVAAGTADDFIWPLVQRKLDVLSSAGLTKDNFSDAQTTHFKDSRQRDLLSYLEHEFMTETDGDSDLVVAADQGVDVNHQLSAAQPRTAQTNSSTGSRSRQTSILSYTSPQKRPAAATAAGNAPSDSSTGSHVADDITSLDDDGEDWGDVNDEELLAHDLDAPSEKKRKM